MERTSAISALLVKYTVRIYADYDLVWIVGAKLQQESGENAIDGRQHWLQEIRAAQGKLFYYMASFLSGQDEANPAL